MVFTISFTRSPDRLWPMIPCHYLWIQVANTHEEEEHEEGVVAIPLHPSYKYQMYWCLFSSSSIQQTIKNCLPQCALWTSFAALTLADRQKISSWWASQNRSVNYNIIIQSKLSQPVPLGGCPRGMGYHRYGLRQRLQNRAISNLFLATSHSILQWNNQ